jgi:deoxyribodipyrimidine photo-lyase
LPDRPIIVWFRHDLRLADQAALDAAVVTGAPVLPLFVLDEKSPGSWAPGGASRWWLHESLESLGKALHGLGSKLILRHGPADEVIAGVANETGAAAVHCTRSYEPWSRKLESAVRDRVVGMDIALKRFAGSLLHEPDQLKTKAGDPYKVYTPFWRALSASLDLKRPLPAPSSLVPFKGRIASDTLASWKLLPKRPDWSKGIRDAWQPGEPGAHERLHTFLDERIDDYTSERNRPDRAGTSRLSPHLHFGEMSPRQCWYAAAMRAGRQNRHGDGADTFLKELAWREFSYHLLFHFPDLPDEPFRKEFESFPWDTNLKAERAWQRGQTGYPIVDAGMRELWATGWMHNRVRMIAASFLIKDLLIPWQKGEAWFWDTLVDADLASNAASWQWVAGSGADAAPYFRIFNPVLQGEKFDPDGDYVRRWVPELAKLPASAIHAPWLADEAMLREAGVVLGDTYPHPIVNHAERRDTALAAFKKIKAAV